MIEAIKQLYNFIFARKILISGKVVSGYFDDISNAKTLIASKADDRLDPVRPLFLYFYFNFILNAL